MRARLRAGDHGAFADLFDRYAGAVYHHGFRLGGGPASAEDVVSATFLQAWRLRTRIEVEGGSLRPWLLGIATNVVRNVVRKQRRELGALARLATPDETPDFSDDVAGRLDDTALLDEVRAVLRTLRRAEREVFALCVWAGLDYGAAAEALGIPVGTVRSRLSRARRKLSRLVAGRREPRPFPGQLEGDRVPAVRSTEEGAR
jgi:RNA polymerase sigma-70 factor (ECF subfamily)